ncbi:MAG TPA: RIP metalloprotease RseP [Saccharofermentans sp.]|nr:RIP metalloprotease RseP [Saccharofermentans sp.]
MDISFWSILVVVLMLGILVTVHELGHLWAALLLRIKAFEVSIFVGPKLIAWKSKSGIDFSLRAIPMGAYVRFSEFDEEGKVIESEDSALLINQPRWKRLLVALAGPIMNVLLGVIIMMVMFCTFGFATTNIYKAYEGTQLYECDYNEGDSIVAINGERVFSYLDIQYELGNGQSQHDNMVVTLKDNETNEQYDITLTPEFTTKLLIGFSHYDDTDNKYNGWEIISVEENQNDGDPFLEIGDYIVAIDGIPVTDPEVVERLNSTGEGSSVLIEYVRNGVTYEQESVRSMMTYSNDRGISLEAGKVKSFGSFFEALKTAISMPLSIFNISFRSIGDVFEGHEEVYNMVSGPVGITTAVSDVVDNVDHSVMSKLKNILFLSSIISIALCFSNLLPIPGLDGIQIVMIVVEMIIGRPVSDNVEKLLTAVGFIVLIGLMIFAFASDIIRILIG